MTNRQRLFPIFLSPFLNYYIIILLLLLLPSYIHSERAYPLGCSTYDTTYYDFESNPFPPPNLPIKSPDDYMLVRRLGAGKFSDVFEAVDVQLEKQLLLLSLSSNSKSKSSSSSSFASSTSLSKKEEESPTGTIDPRTLVVLKCLKPVSEKKIKRELLVLQHASKLPNLARLVAVVVPSDYYNDNKKYQLQQMPTLVLEHAGIESQWLCHPNKNNHHYLSDDDIKYYLYHLLIALDQLHSAGIMHRDVKPRNVLIDQTKKSLMLIDLGLADFYLPNTKYNVRVASRHYKSPELLLGYEDYDYAIDMWGVGCILAGLLLRREPVFRGKDNMDQLGKIVNVLGTSDLHAYISKSKIEMTKDIRKVIAKCTLRGAAGKKRTTTTGKNDIWLSLLASSSSSSSEEDSDNYTPSAESLDLLSKLLVYDHETRLTAKQAMQHSFFDSVRDKIESQMSIQQQA